MREFFNKTNGDADIIQVSAIVLSVKTECRIAPDSQDQFLELWLGPLLHPLRLVQLDVELEEDGVAQEGHLPVVAVEALARRPRQVRREALGCNSIDVLEMFPNLIIFGNLRHIFY